MNTSEVLKSKLAYYSSVKIRYRDSRYFYMENGIIGRCSNAGLREVGGSILYVEMWDVFSRTGEKEVLYLQNVLKMNSRDVPANITKVFVRIGTLQYDSAFVPVCVACFVQKARPFVWAFSEFCSNYYGYLLFSLIFVKVFLLCYVVCFCTTTVLFHME